MHRTCNVNARWLESAPRGVQTGAMTLTERIKNHAVELGFDVVGVASAKRAPKADAFHDWISEGHHADMDWLARNPERRADPRIVVEQARSVLSLGVSYFVENPPAELWDDPMRGRVARYAWGRDYHKVMTPMLRDLYAFIEQESPGVKGRYYVDTGPVLEREFAEQAGLGFVGKHSLLITPGFGSYVFLADILLDVELDYDPSPEEKPAGTCGACTRCLDICPTFAFPAPYILDSRKCISYLTIELRGSIDPSLRPLMGNWIYGCDECQSICPWVKQYSKTKDEHWLKADPAWMCPELEELLSLDDEGFLERFKGSPIMRTKRRGLLRNAAVALGNSGNPDAIPVLERALKDTEPLVREHAAWGIERLREG